MTENPQHRAWRVTEPIHAMIYFVPEATEAYTRLGLTPGDGYFAARGAAFGPAGPALVTATFYNFKPALVARALPAVWSVTTPAAVLEARLAAVDAALTRGLGPDVLESPQMAEAARLARRAAEAAAGHPQGRPLFAAHAGLSWPDRPHLVLWHAQMLLREFRGDGHVAALMAAGLSGLESIVLHAATGDVDAKFMRVSRGWQHSEWDAAADDLRERGLLDGDKISDYGRELRAEIEATTDRLAAPAYDVIGNNGCTRLAELTRPFSLRIVKAGMLDPAAALPRPQGRGGTPVTTETAAPPTEEVVKRRSTDHPVDWWAQFPEVSEKFDAALVTEGLSDLIMPKIKSPLLRREAEIASAVVVMHLNKAHSEELAVRARKAVGRLEATVSRLDDRSTSDDTGTGEAYALAHALRGRWAEAAAAAESFVSYQELLRVFVSALRLERFDPVLTVRLLRAGQHPAVAVRTGLIVGKYGWWPDWLLKVVTERAVHGLLDEDTITALDQCAYAELSPAQARMARRLLQGEPDLIEASATRLEGLGEEEAAAKLREGDLTAVALAARLIPL
ncbi:SCO6745 family protein [Paractinoplanes rishiriensis]|uniref:Uncharacterized protein n=1 Tax=Paractinoplanes rishiriensis TaxID=1050105 RepID=A0A919JW01_9ACTN|nr:hypothetical protein [Actinoplanes rishiriensis]GIE94589.1 hypothetical protein Ari01nite_20540 [Actinoplanes rishiriensis]